MAANPIRILSGSRVDQPFRVNERGTIIPGSTKTFFTQWSMRASRMWPARVGLRSLPAFWATAFASTAMAAARLRHSLSTLSLSLVCDLPSLNPPGCFRLSPALQNSKTAFEGDLLVVGSKIGLHNQFFLGRSPVVWEYRFKLLPVKCSVPKYIA